MFPAALLVATLMSAAGADDAIHLTLIPTDAIKKVGYAVAQHATLSGAKPAGLKKAPAGLESPRYAVLPITREDGSATIVIVEEPDGKPGRLFVDSNGNGDLTDDGPAEWQSKESRADDGATMMLLSGGAMVDIGAAGSPRRVHINVSRSDPKNPKFAADKDVLTFHRDYAYAGDISLGGKTYKAALSDDKATGDFRGDGASERDSGSKLLIDVNADGRFDPAAEKFDVRKPFNIAGATYEIAEMTRAGDSFRIVPSDKQAAETKPSHPATSGKKIAPFQAKAYDGKSVKFPEDFKGKVVLLDFWATWCGPCMHEMPHVVETYKKFHDKGFEIQGVSLDNESSIKGMTGVMQSSGMTWSQIADGKGWEAAIAKRYSIRSIPATFLVDGSTGEILGTNLRGDALKAAVEKAVKSKGGKS